VTERAQFGHKQFGNGALLLRGKPSTHGVGLPTGCPIRPDRIIRRLSELLI
jgi:hypothetical protein